MQQCFMFIDTGSGWTPVNDSTKDIAALDSTASTNSPNLP